jgi:plastocyanin
MRSTTRVLLSAVLLLGACAGDPDGLPAAGAGADTTERAAEDAEPEATDDEATDPDTDDDETTDDDGSGAGREAGAVVEALDDGLRFSPDDLEVEVGTTVTWVNGGAVNHNVIGGPLTSGTLEPGDSFSFTFDEPGEITYQCYFHGGMEGTVRVVG